MVYIIVRAPRVWYGTVRYSTTMAVLVAHYRIGGKKQKNNYTLEIIWRATTCCAVLGDIQEGGGGRI